MALAEAGRMGDTTGDDVKERRGGILVRRRLRLLRRRAGVSPPSCWETTAFQYCGRVGRVVPGRGGIAGALSCQLNSSGRRGSKSAKTAEGREQHRWFGVPFAVLLKHLA